MSQSPPPLMGPARVVSDDAMRRWRKRRRRMRRRLRRAGDVFLVVLALLAIVFALHHRQSKPHKTTASTDPPGSLNALYPPKFDVALQGCTFANFGVHGNVYIYNHSPKIQKYYVDVVFFNGARKYAEAVGRSHNLRPKDHVTVDATIATRAAPPKHLTCKVSSIERFGGDPVKTTVKPL